MEKYYGKKQCFSVIRIFVSSLYNRWNLLSLTRRFAAISYQCQLVMDHNSFVYISLSLFYEIKQLKKELFSFNSHVLDFFLCESYLDPSGSGRIWVVAK